MVTAGPVPTIERSPSVHAARAGRRPLDLWRRLRAAAVARPFALDLGLAATLCALGVLSMNLTADRYGVEGSPMRVSRGWGWMLVPVITLATAGRRRWPLATLAVCTGVYMVSVVQQVVEPYATVIAVLLAIYSAGVFGRRPAASWCRLAAIAALFAQAFYYGVLRADDYPVDAEVYTLLQVFQISLNVFYFAAAWVAGDIMCTRRLKEAELAERAVELEAAQSEVAGKAVLDERVRIARELHDVVAHHVSVMGVQAGAARRVLERDPERAADALSSVEASSRAAVAELHRLLGFLRSDDEPDTAGPQPTLRQLQRLLDQMRETGLSIDLRCSGAERALPPGVDLSAYRVVQEAVTNSLKHAGPGTHVEVTLTYRPDAIEVLVIDGGGALFRPRPPKPEGRHRNGLLGMRERVGLHGGTFEAGPRTGGGFEVRALFPTARS